MERERDGRVPYRTPHLLEELTDLELDGFAVTIVGC
jgi:hypothetical protein